MVSRFLLRLFNHMRLVSTFTLNTRSSFKKKVSKKLFLRIRMKYLKITDSALDEKLHQVAGVRELYHILTQKQRLHNNRQQQQIRSTDRNV